MCPCGSDKKYKRCCDGVMVKLSARLISPIRGVPARKSIIEACEVRFPEGLWQRALLVGKPTRRIGKRSMAGISGPQSAMPTGARNPFYEFMREVAPGDLVFSFVDTRIVAIGTVASYCYESPKPTEFGGVGLNWEAIGWRVRVNAPAVIAQSVPGNVSV
jgi:hypothetical protein